MSIIKSLEISGAEVFPLIEGGKGISISSGFSAGSWAEAGGVGTFSAANADAYDENGNLIRLVYKGKTRRERHEELIAHGVRGAIAQAKIAHDCSKGNGRIHMNVLWEMADVKRILYGALEGAKGLIHGVTCGAGMPYDLSYIAAKFGVFYYPIVSSSRAFAILWKRSYKNFANWLGGVVYEDPWKAGGHNGLSTKEDPQVPQSPYERVVELRKCMKELGLQHVPIIMAGNVWHLNDWKHWIDNEEIGKIAFQFGTRPLLTQESPIPDLWKKKLLDIQEGDVFLHKFSPTGFYSSAVKNQFLQNLIDRSNRQVHFKREKCDDFDHAVPVGRGDIFVTKNDYQMVQKWTKEGFTQPMKTPEETVIFVTPAEAQSIKKDQIDCMGCLSRCKFSNWTQEDPYNTGVLPDPRSFCIQKTLQAISHAHEIGIEGFSKRLNPSEIAQCMKNSSSSMSNSVTEITNEEEKYLSHLSYDTLHYDIYDTTPSHTLSYEDLKDIHSLAKKRTEDASGDLVDDASLIEKIEENLRIFEQNLMFSGQVAFRFAKDKFYFSENGEPKIPTAKELVNRIMTGF